MIATTLRQQTAVPTNAIRLLVVAADAADQALTAALGSHGFTLTYANSLGEAVRQVVAAPPDAVLVLLSAETTPQCCEVLSALGCHAVLVATAGLAPHLATACLDQGADAVLAFPLPERELAARIGSVLRRTVQDAQAPSARSITTGDLVVDAETHAVRWRGAEVDLSPTEFAVLAALAERPGSVVTNRELLVRIWGEEYVDDVHYVRLYIGYLRSKLEDDPRRPRLILNQWGVGYRLAMLEPAPVQLSHQH